MSPEQIHPWLVYSYKPGIPELENTYTRASSDPSIKKHVDAFLVATKSLASAIESVKKSVDSNENSTPER
jgi:hypothetical protein